MIAGSNVLNNASWLDPVGGLLISMMVVQAGWGNTRMALLELADVGIEDEMKENVHRAATKALSSINASSAGSNVELRSVQGIKAGQNYMIDLELAVPGSWTVDQTRGVEDLVRERIGAKVRGVKRVRVRFISKESAQSDYLDEFIGADVSAKSTPEEQEKQAQEDEDEHEHDHSHDQKDASSSARRRK
jgi:divalent metal cation (Fe/Co/Zn/Cd) transporter